MNKSLSSCSRPGFRKVMPGLFTFAVLDQSVAIVTRFAVLAVRSLSVVEAVETFSRHAVAGRPVVLFDVVVALTLLTAGSRYQQVAIETRSAPVTART